MTQETKELVTKVDVQPDLAGLLAFEAEIDRAIGKVNKLDAAIKRVNELRPATRYSPPVNNPGATAAAAGLSAGLGANLVNRGALAPIVRKASEDVAKNAANTAATGVNMAIEDMRGRLLAGGGRIIPRIGIEGGGAGGFGDRSGAHNAGGFAGGVSRPEDFRPNAFNRFNFNNMDWSAPGDLKPGSPEVARTPKTPGAGMRMPDMMVGAASAYALSAGLGAVAENLDRIQSQEAQLARLPQTIGSSKDAFIALNEAASDVRSNGDAFITTYTNMATATEKLGLSQAETMKSAQGMVSALQLGGGSKVAINNALYQMGQAFSSNRFGGDEFRSFMEAIGTMAPTVAKAFGTDVAGLRKMSEAGELTAEKMTKAFAVMADNNMELLKKQGWTWAQVTAVMGNDWDNFVATATENGEWARLMSWVATNITPTFKSAEMAVAKFWNSTTDESKASILIGILAAIGAAFVALAVPVLAATWPFLAVGAAVFLLWEVFQEFKHWMDGSAKTIFDSLFGSFDEFERRYPYIIASIKNLMELMKMTDDFSGWVHQKTIGKLLGEQQETPEEGGLLNGANNTLKAGKAMGGAAGGWGNPLSWLEDILSIPHQLSELPMLPPALTQGGKQTNITNTNSGNTTITVATPEEAAAVANARDASFVNQASGGLDNMAEGGGYA
ncbi:tape measure protein [Enterobacter mori]|uniref:tape measure protein n=1 Tax=Enterobacter mori TaxID=539813 RepID=UPI001B8BC7AC|nr:tape measure protein [Enterobacter mori]MBS3046026.1 tape measure protein [Enterobacter mori]